MPYKDPDKQRKFQRERAALNRKLWFADQAPCYLCRSFDNLQLHHIDPSTKVSHSVWSWSKERRELELAKCIVLCRDCHHKQHGQYQKKPLVHGTFSAYAYKGCRCDVCREANRKHKQDYTYRMKAI